jgi:hypothetical protein
MYLDFETIRTAEENLHKMNTKMQQLRDELLYIRNGLALRSVRPERPEMIAELDRIEDRMAEEYELLLMAARQLSFVRERVLRSEKNILLHLNGERRKPEEKLVMIDNEIEKDVPIIKRIECKTRPDGTTVHWTRYSIRGEK